MKIQQHSHSSLPAVGHQTRSCNYPDDLDSRGHRCGGRAASVRPGGDLGGSSSSNDHKSEEKDHHVTIKIPTITRNYRTGSDGDDALSGSINHSYVFYGGDGNDRLTGYKYDDTLVGGRGNDRLIGKEGNDTLIGNSGVDLLIGGKDADKFVFSVSQNSGEARADVITDFKPSEDQIVLKGLDRKLSFAIVSSEGKAKISEALIVYNKTDGSLFYNENKGFSGFGNDGSLAILKPGLSLSSSDFTVER